MNDYEKFWYTGSGVRAAHHFSADWLDDAVLERAKTSGDLRFAEKLLPELITQYNGWDKHFDADTGLYWSIPADDAMEWEPAGMETSKPFSGVPTYRPTLNAYQYGNAMAISEIARRAGDQAIAEQFQAKAQALRKNMLKWDPQRQFFYDVLKPDNPQHQRLDTREQVGYIPWYFNIPDAVRMPELFSAPE
jgi:glycogen debranching enzyme